MADDRDERAGDEAGDAQDALPGFATTPADQIPPDEGDIGESGAPADDIG